MQLEVVGSEDEPGELLTRSEEVEPVDAAKGIWMRCCPQCGALLRKHSRGEAVRCGCGWEWQC